MSGIIVGICGNVGVGKTTLAYDIIKELQTMKTVKCYSKASIADELKMLAEEKWKMLYSDIKVKFQDELRQFMLEESECKKEIYGRSYYTDTSFADSRLKVNNDCIVIYDDIRSIEEVRNVDILIYLHSEDTVFKQNFPEEVRPEIIYNSVDNKIYVTRNGLEEYDEYGRCLELTRVIRKIMSR